MRFGNVYVDVKINGEIGFGHQSVFGHWGRHQRHFTSDVINPIPGSNLAPFLVAVAPHPNRGVLPPLGRSHRALDFRGAARS